MVLLLFHIGTDFRNNRSAIRATARRDRLVPNCRYNRLKTALETQTTLYAWLLYLVNGDSLWARALGQIGLVKRAYPQRL